MRGLLQFCNHARDLIRRQFLLVGKELPKHGLVDIAVVLVFEIAPIPIAESCAQQRHDPILNSTFDFNGHFLAFQITSPW